MVRNRYPEWDEEIVRLYVEEGLTQKEIAERIGWSRRFVSNRLIHHKVPTRKSGHYRIWPDQHKNMDRTIFLYRDMKMTTDEVAEVLGVARATVIRRLQAAGVERRGRGGAGKNYYAKLRSETQ